MIEVGWEQVRAFRLARSGLVERAPPDGLVTVVSRLCGVHAQVMSSAELALAARVDGIDAEAVRAALWERRELVKTWAMRGTLHLLPSDELALWIGALRERAALWRRPVWLRAVGLRLEELEAVVEAVGAALAGRQLTREELTDAVVERVGEHVAPRLASGWGEFLKPAAANGDLVFAPNRGRNVTFVRPADRVGEFEPLEPRDAMREVARRWLATYGPGSHEDFARWWGIPHMRPARAALESIGDERVELSLAGRKVSALVEDVEALASAEVPGRARLLPGFDPYVVNFYPRDGLVTAAVKDRVFRVAGWISPVVLVEGRPVAAWEHRIRGKTFEVRVEPFRRLAAARLREVEADAERFAALHGLRPSVEVVR